MYSQDSFFWEQKTNFYWTLSLIYPFVLGKKINQKNTWSLKLIDYIDDVIAHQEQQHQDAVIGTNFQAVSCTLDASVKIYSHRVDSVHTAAYQMLGDLVRAETKGDDEQQNDNTTNNETGADNQKESTNDDEESDDKSSERPQKKVHWQNLFIFLFCPFIIIITQCWESSSFDQTKASIRGINTLETNLSNINAKKIDLEFSVDPLFRKTSASFDEGIEWTDDIRS